MKAGTLINLSSRPERSEVEGPALLHFAAVESESTERISDSDTSRNHLPAVALSVLAESLAVRSCFSHANGRPSMARLIVFSKTSEKTWR